MTQQYSYDSFSVKQRQTCANASCTCSFQVWLSTILNSSRFLQRLVRSIHNNTIIFDRIRHLPANSEGEILFKNVFVVKKERGEEEDNSGTGYEDGQYPFVLHNRAVLRHENIASFRLLDN